MPWADGRADWLHFIHALSPGPGEVILDVGAGKGAVASRVRQASNVEVWAAEPEGARVATMGRESPAVIGVVAAAEWLPFPDAFFDKSYATLSLHHFADASAALGEIARVVKVGGRLVVLEVDPRSAKGRLFRIIGRLMGEKMIVRSQEQLSEIVTSTGRFRVEHPVSQGSYYLLQAARI